MAIRLYDITLTDKNAAPRQNFGKPNVRATPAKLAGHYDLASGQIVCADRDAVRACLPYQLRKAFDRAGVWYPSSPGAPVTAEDKWHAYADLYSARKRYLGTVRMIPRVEP